MINKAKILRSLSLSVAALCFVLIGGQFASTNAQNRDPFAKPGWARKQEARPGGAANGKKADPLDFGVPSIERRIEFYKRLREGAAANGQPLPKVTTVLTLNEMQVTGIFRTPRGYAAMVEATPIKLSYTVYPGEKFFDGQLVAVEENRLVFRRVTKLGKGKFVSSVENKALREYSDREQLQGTAPMQTDAKTDAAPQPAESASATAKPPVPVVSPLDEMNKQMPSDPAKDKSKKDSKKPAKVARNK